MADRGSSRRAGPADRGSVLSSARCLSSSAGFTHSGPGYGKSWWSLLAEHAADHIKKRFRPTLSSGGCGGDLDRYGDCKRDD